MFRPCLAIIRLTKISIGIWYLGSKLQGISDNNCSNLAQNSYTVVTAVCFKPVCQFILNADFSTAENWRFVFIFLQANKQPSTHPRICGVAETVYIKHNL
jgi:hypothetical protein